MFFGNNSHQKGKSINLTQNIQQTNHKTKLESNFTQRKGFEQMNKPTSAENVGKFHDERISDLLDS